MRSRRNKEEEHVDNHRWVISYADFITLLFAFFVVMYAISSLNISKYKSLTEGMKSAFNNNKVSKSTADKMDGPQVKETTGAHNDGMDNLNDSLSELADGNFKVNRQEGWIELDIKAGSLFAAGENDIKPEALIKLMQLATKIKDLPYTVVVEGYTDNTPIETPQYPSNWELSASRAATVGRILNGYGIANYRILVMGYGDQFPIANNLTEEGRGQNRRVSIIIAKDRKIDRVSNPEIGQTHNAVLGTVQPVPYKADTKTDKDPK
ncbi:MAG: flagellar motor protein MotB, partial [Legionella sp.]|nr:flagellar motor protein MotB [Legionella sp.]